MLRHSLVVLSSFALASGLFACSAGTTSTSSSGNPSPTGTSSSSTDPAGDDAGHPGKGGGGSALGPSCKAYIACCEELAASNPQVGASCDSVKSQIEMAEANGVSTSTYE